MFSYQPLTNALQRGDWRGALTQVKEQLDAANRQPDSHTDLTATGGLELPAPLKGVPEKILKRTAYTVSSNSFNLFLSNNTNMEPYISLS